MAGPQIGRIVHFVDCEGTHYPAIVTRVHESGEIGFQVFGRSSTPILIVEKAAPGSWHWPEGSNEALKAEAGN